MTQETMNTILTSVLVPVLVAVAGFIIAFLQQKSKELQEKTKSEKAKKYIDLAERTVCQAVQKVFQTYVDTLQASGKFGEEEAKIAFSLARMETLKLLTASAREAIQMVYGDLDAWLSTVIEYNVRVSKVATTPSSLV